MTRDNAYQLQSHEVMHYRFWLAIDFLLRPGVMSCPRGGGLCPPIYSASIRQYSHGGVLRTNNLYLCGQVRVTLL